MGNFTVISLNKLSTPFLFLSYSKLFPVISSVIRVLPLFSVVFPIQSYFLINHLSNLHMSSSWHTICWCFYFSFHLFFNSRISIWFSMILYHCWIYNFDLVIVLFCWVSLYVFQTNYRSSIVWISLQEYYVLLVLSCSLVFYIPLVWVFPCWLYLKKQLPPLVFDHCFQGRNIFIINLSFGIWDLLQL